MKIWLTHCSNSIKYIICVILSMSVIFSGAIIKPTIVNAVEYKDTPLVFDAKKHIPTIDPDVGDGTKLSTDPTAIIPINNLNSNVKSALVRVTANNPNKTVLIYSGNYSVLQSVPGLITSNTFLTSITSGGVNIYASDQINVRVEVISAFESNINTPGSVVALEKPVRRADTMQDLSGQSLANGVRIGVNGAGGVPSEPVRAVFYTATIITQVNNSTLEIGDNLIDVPYKGMIHISSVAVPDSNGNIQAKLWRTRDKTAVTEGQITFDIRGYVVNSKPGSQAINSTGSFIPKITNIPTRVSLDETQNSGTATFDVPNTSSDSQYSLFLVQVNDQTNARPTTVDLGDEIYAREQGVSVDPKIGTLPQLIMAKIDKKTSTVRLHYGSGTVNIYHVGDIIGEVNEEMKNANETKTPKINITSPKNGDNIDYKSAQTVSIDGTYEEGESSLGVLNIWSDYKGGFNIGTLETRYLENGVANFHIDIHPPESGNYTFTISATDRFKNESHSQVSVYVKMYDPNEAGTIYWPKTRKIEDGTKYKIINPDNIIMDCDDSIIAGNTIYSGYTPQTPSGLIRKVKSVDIVTNGCKYTTEDGDISDVAQNVTIPYQNIDLTNMISQEAMKSFANQQIHNEDGSIAENVKLDNVKLVDDSEIKSADQISDQGGRKPNFCTPDFKPLDGQSDCSLIPTLDEYTISNPPLTDDDDDNAAPEQDVTLSKPENSIDKNENEQLDEPGAVSSTNSAYSSPRINAFTGEIISGENAKYSVPTDGMKGLMLSDIAQKNEVLKKDNNGSKAMHFDFSISVKATWNAGDPVPKSISGMFGNAKAYSPQSKKEDPQETELDDLEGDGSGADAPAPSGPVDSSHDGSKTSATITVSFDISYSKDIKFYVDSSASFRVWFPSWHFWDIHVDLDLMLAKSTEQTSKTNVSLGISASLSRKTYKVLQLDFPIVAGIISVGFDLSVYIQGSVNAKGTYTKTNYEYERNGIKFHNTSKTKIDEKKSEVTEQKFSGSIEFSFTIGITISPKVELISFIFIGFNIDMGIKFSISVYSYVPNGSNKQMAQGKFAIDFVFNVSFTGGLDFKIFKISFSVNLVNITVNLYTVYFKNSMPDTNIGRVIINTGITTSDNASNNEYREPNSEVLFEVQKLNRYNQYSPAIMVDKSTANGYSKTDKTDGGSTDVTYLGKDGKFGRRSYSDVKFPNKTDGTDGVLYISTGNSIALNSPDIESLKASVNRELSQYGDMDTINSLYDSANTLGQLGFIKPNQNGSIVLDYLPPGSYRIRPLSTPNGTKPTESNYDFTIDDWQDNSTTNNDGSWSNKILKAIISVPLVFSPQYTVDTSIRNVSRQEEFGSNNNSDIVKPNDIVELKTKINYPNEQESGGVNVGSIIGSKLVLDNSIDSNDQSIDFNAPELDVLPEMTCYYPAPYTPTPNAPQIYQSRTLFLNQGINNYIDLGYDSSDSQSFSVQVDGKPDTTSIGSEAYKFPAGSKCEVVWRGVVRKIGYAATHPQLIYNSPQNTVNFPANGNARNGTPLEAWGTELTFKNMQKYTYPLVYVPCVEYQLTDSKSEPVDVSSVTSDLGMPYGDIGQVVNKCSNATGSTHNPTNSHIFSSSKQKTISGDEIEAGIIDLFYLQPGNYTLTQMSAPEHFKQDGVIINFTITKPNKNSPRDGYNNQGAKEIPPEIIANADVSVDDQTKQYIYKDKVNRDFSLSASGKVNFTGQNQNYKGAPNDNVDLTFKLSYPKCGEVFDEDGEPDYHNCNIGPTANAYLTTSLDPSNSTLNLREYNSNYIDGDTTKYPKNTSLTAQIGQYSCVAYAKPSDASGNLQNLPNDAECSNSNTNDNSIYFRYTRLLPAGSVETWNVPETLTLLKNQTTQLDVSLDGDDGSPSKGNFNSIQFNRGFASIFAKEKNSYPLDDANAELISGIGVGDVTFDLYNSDNQKINSASTNSADYNQYQYRVSNVSQTNFATTTPFEHLDEGDYYYQINSVPNNYYFDKDQKYWFNIQYQRLENDKQIGKSSLENPNEVKESYYITSTAFIDYNPNFTLDTKIKNISRNSNLEEQNDDVIIKNGDIIEYVTSIDYENNPNSAMSYNPSLKIVIPEAIDISNSKATLIRDGSVSRQNEFDFSSSIDIGTVDSENKYNKSSGEINIGENRSAFIPGDHATIIWRGKASDDITGKVVTKVESQYNNDIAVHSQEKDNITYPGHINLKVGERWSKNRLIKNVPFKVIKDENSQMIDNFNDLPNNNKNIASNTANNNIVYSDEQGELMIDYLENGHYKLIPDTENELWPKGYILGDSIENGYDNDQSMNDDGQITSFNRKEIDFTIEDYNTPNAKVNLNLGTFELYYQPQIDLVLKVKNTTRGESDFKNETIIKPNDEVEYEITASYLSNCNSSVVGIENDIASQTANACQNGLLHSPKLQLRDNSGNNLTIDADTLKIYSNGDQLDDSTYSFNDNLIILPDNIEPNSRFRITFNATISEIDAAILWGEFQFDHIFINNEYNQNNCAIYKNTALQTVTELHSIGTRFLDDANIALYSEDDRRINVKNVASIDNYYSDNALENGDLFSEETPFDDANLTKEQINGLKYKANSIKEEYLEPGKYYFTQTKAPIGYKITKEKFYFTILPFDINQYISGEKYHETSVNDLLDQNPDLSRTYFIENEYKTVHFDYEPYLSIETSMQNASRDGSVFEKEVIAKPGDKLNVLTKVSYPQDIEEIDIHNRGVVYGAKLINEVHNSNVVKVSLDDGKTYQTELNWDNNELMFGSESGSLETSDNSDLRIYPGQTIYLQYEESYDQEQIINYNEKIIHRYDSEDVINGNIPANRTDKSYVYFGKVSFSTFETLLDGTKQKLPNTALVIYNSDNSDEELQLTNVAKYDSAFCPDSNNSDIKTGEKTRSAAITNQEDASSSIEYLTPGDYYLKVVKVPDGNLLDQNIEYHFSIPKIDLSKIETFSSSENSVLDITLDPFEIGVRRVIFTVKSNTGDPLKDTSINIREANNDADLKFISPQWNENLKLYTSDDSGQILLDHVPQNNYSITEQIASADFEFTAGDKTEITVINDNWQFNTDDRLYVENSNNIRVLDPTTIIKQQNTSTSPDQSNETIKINIGDHVKLFADLTVPEKISVGSYRSFEFNIDPSLQFDLPLLYYDLFIDGKYIEQSDYSITQNTGKINVKLNDDMIPILKSKNNISLQILLNVNSNLTNQSKINSQAIVNTNTFNFPELNQIKSDQSTTVATDLDKYDNRDESIIDDKSDKAQNNEVLNSNEDESQNSLIEFSTQYLWIVIIILLIALTIFLFTVKVLLRRKKNG